MSAKFIACDHERVDPPDPPAMSAQLYRTGRGGGPVKLTVYISDGVFPELGILTITPGRFFYAGDGEFVWDVAESVEGFGHHKPRAVVTRQKKVWAFTLKNVSSIYRGFQGTVACDVEILSIVHAESLRFRVNPIPKEVTR